jgi:uncharacterized protein YegL
MPYGTMATKKTPALIVYLLDMSLSMGEWIYGRPKIDLITDTLMSVVREMVRRSTKGTTPSPRYRVAIYAYNDTVRDLLNGPRPITELLTIGVPQMKPGGQTDTAAAFRRAEQLLIDERANLRNCPAPLVCHLTDGQYNTEDPRPIVERIRQMTFPDGAVLVENIFFDADALDPPVTDPYRWNGVTSASQLATTTAKQLFEMSSAVPDSYLQLFSDRGYSLKPGARLIFPGDTPEMVEAAFTMSGMTPVA